VGKETPALPGDIIVLIDKDGRLIMKERLLLALISVLLMFTSGLMARALYFIWRDGGVLVKGNQTVLMSQMIMFSFFAGLGGGCLIYVLQDILKNIMSYSGRRKHGKSDE
jgi:hypothetical protein